MKTEIRIYIHNFIIISIFYRKMVWYFNYCAPVLPNDPTINFHRYFQCGALIVVFVLYIFFHIYYQMCGPQPLEEHQVNSNNEESQEGSDSDKGLEHNTQNSDDKSISINGGIIRDQNQSYVTFTSKPGEWNQGQKEKKEKKKKVNYEIIQNVTILEVEGFFSIVVGHYSLAVAISILYSPYFQQSIGAAIYTLLGIVLMILNSKRLTTGIYVIWGLMCAVIVFLILSAALQIGQTQWNSMTKRCFVLDYQPLY